MQLRGLSVCRQLRLTILHYRYITVRKLIIRLGTPAFVIQDFTPDAPNPDKEMKQPCLLCDEPKKLADMRNHVGHHILLHSHDAGEGDLLKTVSVCPNRVTNADSHTRSVITLAGSVVATCAVPASQPRALNDRSIPTASSTTRSSMALLRSLQKAPLARTFQLHAPIARRRFGNTMPSATSRLGTRPFWKAVTSILNLFSILSLVKRRRARSGSPTNWWPTIVPGTRVSFLMRNN